MSKKLFKILNSNEINIVNVEKSIYEQDYIEERCIEYGEGKNSIFQCIKIDTIEQLRWLFDQILNSEDRAFVYRGHQDSNWFLQSTLERYAIENKIYMRTLVNSFNYFEEFRKLSRGRIKEQWLLRKSSEIENIYELWAIGQHFGLKTPLLDWSKSFYIALFFAFEKEADVEYRSIHRIDLSNLDKGNNYVPDYIEPNSDPYGRLTAQKGLFTTTQSLEILKKYYEHFQKPERDNKELSKMKSILASKFYISNQLRKDILKYLEHIGITLDSIYPDLHGAILKANSDLDLQVKEYKESEKYKESEEIINVTVGFSPTFLN